MELWNNKLFKINCDRVIDSLLTIFSHLLKGEKLIESHVGKNESNVATPTPAEPSGTAAASSATPAAGAGGGRDPLPEVPNMYSELLNILVDMGFPRETAAYALLQTENDVEQAAEFLLSNSSANRTNVRIFRHFFYYLEAHFKDCFCCLYNSNYVMCKSNKLLIQFLNWP